MQRSTDLPADPHALVDVGVYVGVVAGGRQGVLHGRVQHYDVRVAAGGDQSLAGVDVEDLGGRRAGDTHEVGRAQQACIVRSKRLGKCSVLKERQAGDSSESKIGVKQMLEWLLNSGRKEAQPSDQAGNSFD